MTAVARLREVVFASRHPASIARFRAAALDGYQVAPYDARAGAEGREDRVHLDLAQFADHLILRDPEGNEFCLSGRS